MNSEIVENILDTTDWRLMVIGQNTASQSWLNQFTSHKLFYLSFDEMLQLELNLVQFISNDTNSQKNIGYLVAIFCGAKIIYELNSESMISRFDGQIYSEVQSATEVPWLAFHLAHSPFVNVYGIFGQPQIWPRGLPIDDIQNISQDGWSSLRRNDNEIINGYIQQKLFDFHPDVDALIQLVHSVPFKRIVFDHERLPIALEPFTFSPYNSQNTIHYFNAFWGLYLPNTVDSEVADIWRSFWVQRLLWDIEGSLLFASSNMKRYKGFKVSQKNIKKQQIIHDDGKRFVRFLSTWKSTTATLYERIQELIDALIKEKLFSTFESKIIHAWLTDLKRIGYKFPSVQNEVKSRQSAVRTRRAAVCLTGLAECVMESWSSNEMKLRQRLNGDIDVFLFLSDGDRTRNPPSNTIDLRLKEARYYNATVNIIHQDILDINPGFPPTCKYQYIYTQKKKIVPIEQERLAQANCYKIVRDYEKKSNIRYELLIRARTDSVFTRLPKTFERNGTFNPNHNIVVPNEHHYYGINDRFAIGHIDLMEYYMCRWYQLPLCYTEIVHPESFLLFILKKNGINATADIEISLVQVPHGKNQCH